MKQLSMCAFSMLVQFYAFTAFADAGCGTVQVRSMDPVTAAESIGNAIPYSPRFLVTNDHVLAPGVKTVDLSCNGKKVKGEVLGRDFHTDIALIQLLEPMNLQVPKWGAKGLESQQEVDLILGEAGNSGTVRYSGLVKSTNSGRLEVPGIIKALEITGPSGTALSVRQSMSGSGVYRQGVVVGMVTQKTPEGAVLAIPAAETSQVVDKMARGTLPVRPYTYDYRGGAIQFRGLTIRKEEQKRRGSANPSSESGGTPHEGMGVLGKPKGEGSIFRPRGGNQSIALEDYEIGYAVATMTDARVVKALLPQVFEALKAAGTTRVFVSSIDGHRVTSMLSLARAMGECDPCKIDSFWVETKHPELFESVYLQVNGYLSKLILSLEKSGKMPTLKNFVGALQAFNISLNALSESNAKGIRDNRLSMKARQQWQEAEKALDGIWHSEETLDTLEQLRERIERI
jgi:hypothetical protein